MYGIDSRSTPENLETIRDIITSHQILYQAEIIPKLPKRTRYPNKYYYGGQNRPASPFSRFSLYNAITGLNNQWGDLTGSDQSSSNLKENIIRR